MASLGPRSLLIAVAALVAGGILYLWSTTRVDGDPAPGAAPSIASERTTPPPGPATELERPVALEPATGSAVDARSAVATATDPHPDAEPGASGSLSVLFADPSGEPLGFTAIVTSTRLAETEDEALAAVFELVQMRPDGRVFIADLPAGEYRVWASRWPRLAHAIVRLEPGADVEVREFDLIEKTDRLRTIYTGPADHAACQVVSDGKVFTRHPLVNPALVPAGKTGPTTVSVGQSVFVRYFIGDRFVDRVPELENGEWVTRCCD